MRVLETEAELLILPSYSRPQRFLPDILPRSLEEVKINFCAWLDHLYLKPEHNSFDRISEQLRGIADSKKFRKLSKFEILIPRFGKDSVAESQWRKLGNGFVELLEDFKVANIELVVKFDMEDGLKTFYEWLDEVLDEQNNS